MPISAPICSIWFNNARCWISTSAFLHRSSIAVYYQSDYFDPWYGSMVLLFLHRLVPFRFVSSLPMIDPFDALDLGYTMLSLIFSASIRVKSFVFAIQVRISVFHDFLLI